MDRKELSESRYAGQRQKHRRLNRYYFSLSPTSTAVQNDQPLGDQDSESQEDIFIPVFFTIVEQMLPQAMFQLFGSHPPLEVYGRTEEDHKNAESIEMQLEYDFQQSQLFLRSIPIIKQRFKYGTGVFKVGYKYDTYERDEVWERMDTAGLNEDGKIIEKKVREKVKTPVTRYDGPWLEPWAISLFWPDPLFCRIPEMRYVCADRYTDKRRLRWENEMFQKLTGEKLYKNLDDIPPLPRNVLENLLEGGGPEEEVQQALGWSTTLARYNQYQSVPKRGFHEEDDTNDVVRITEYWSVDEEDFGDRMVYVANDETVIADGPIPFEDKEIPFGATRCFEIEDEFWGYGLLHPIEPLQEAVNSQENLGMRNAAYNALRVWAVSEDVDVPPNATFFNPGDVIQVPFHTSGRPMAADLFQPRANPPETERYVDRMIGAMQRAVGSTAMIEPSADTATEAKLMQGGIAARDRMLGATAELEYLEVVARFFISRRQQFFDEEQSIRILGPKGATFERLSRQDIAGQLLEALALVKGDPILTSITDVYELWSEVLKSFDIRFHERLLNPPTDKTWDPQLENKVLDAGEALKVEPSEPHEKHVQVHEQGKMVAVQNGAGPEVLRAYDEHVAEHQKLIEIAGSQAPPQEQPGGIRGEQGNQPRAQNAVPSEARLLSRVGGRE
jgi:hypothetical protein